MHVKSALNMLLNRLYSLVINLKLPCYDLQKLLLGAHNEDNYEKLLCLQ